MNKSRPVTLKDLGRLLGISYSTVSRALSGHPDVSAETVDAVKKLAKELHYRPHATAISLRNHESKVIGLIVPKISYFYVPSVINAIEEEVSKEGYKLMILQSNESYEKEVECIEIFILNDVDGILASVSSETAQFDHFREAQQLGIPLVLFDRVATDFPSDKVVVDGMKGTYKGISHLVSTGCRRIALMLGNPKISISINRLTGYTIALRDHHIPFDETIVAYSNTPEEAEKNTMALLALPEPPDAIFAISDLLLVGIMQGIRKMGKKVPDDISVVGFSDEPFAVMYNPPITSVLPLGAETGKAAVDILMQRIKQNSNEYELINKVLQTRIEVRGSTKWLG